MEILNPYDELIKVIFNGKKTDVLTNCDIKCQELELKKKYGSWRIKKMILNLIKLSYKNNNLFFGEYLEAYESTIIEHMIKCYTSALSVFEFETFLRNIEKYGVIFKILSNEKVSSSEYIYDFFFILLKGNEIKTTLNKYFDKFSQTSIHYDISINELIECINNSQCLSDNKCDYNKLSTSIFNLSEKNKKLKNSGETKTTNTNKKRRKKKKTKYDNKNLDYEDSKDFQEKKNSDTFNSDTPLFDLNENLKNEEEIGNNIETNESNNNEINEINENNNNETIQQQHNIGYMDYFRKRKEFYNNNNIDTPILDKIINEELQIDFDLFILKKGNPLMFDQHYKNLKRIIDIFKDEKKASEEISKKSIGYFTYTFFGKHFEGIYAAIPKDLLFEEITDKTKFQREDFNDKNDEIADNCFKARGLSFEYYINDLIIKNFGFEDLPRAIYCFKPLDISINIKEIVELDSIFYSKNEEKLNIKELPFLDDDIIKRNKEFYSKNNEIKFKFEAGINDEIIFDKNSLNLFEIKSRFPTNNPNDKRYLETEVDSLFEKVIIFHELYKERFVFFDKVKVIFFYDSVRKEGYEKILVSKINEFINAHKSLADKFEFQIIFIPSSFFAIGIKNLTDKINFLETLVTQNNIIINNLKISNENLSNENKVLKAEVEYLKISNENLSNENKILKAGIEDLKAGMENLKAGMENLSKENKILKDEINKINGELSHSKQEI